MRKIQAEVADLQGKGYNVYFYGNKSHIFRYLYPESSLGIDSFFQPVETLQFISQIERKISGKEKIAIFVVNLYPEKRAIYEITPLENELQNLGLERVVDEAMIFYKK
ncbi:hypothetical protein LZ575_20610 [Antarcticibacterium sp. 1MA-6-2]|uniref:hypothetical protein n=1 Tax=Antarcticibacterium sp. 1MA-6-2 TaxID=2908210 RepID=UPI001F29F8F5|nr:hypothetical protein [Antarcticibacterium sp. 1MA-6-2]UJH91037.1 hypothetical protein LZ575_20610 [Antarcticibacterium sp. 1MA-6-2]